MSMTYWDGSRWRSESVPTHPQQKRTAGDWIATLLMLVVLGALTLSVPVRGVGPTLALSPNAVAPGQKLSVAGSAFTPSQRVQLAWDGSTTGMPAIAVGRGGSFTSSITISPSTAPGDHQVSATAVPKGNSKKPQATTTIITSAVVTVTVPLSVAPSPSAPTPSPTPTAAPATPVLTPAPADATSSPPTNSPEPLATDSPLGSIATPLATASSPPVVTPPAGGALALGAYISGAPWNPTKIDEYTQLVGAPPKIVMWYQSWAYTGVREFDPTKMNAVATRGAMPMITWTPMADGGVDQPTYALRTIIAGQHDAYIHAFARAAASWGKPFYLRFAHEMNGDWESWSPGVNGNTTAEYIAAWRHVVDAFRAEGAVNVRWVWSPNTPIARTGITYASVYPGDAYVDWVALDGYNWGIAASWSSWHSLADEFSAGYRELASLTSRPMMIAETASAEVGGNKGAWISGGLLTDLPAFFPRIRAVIWFDENKETDWRVNSSSGSLAAFRLVVASSTYRGLLP